MLRRMRSMEYWEAIRQRMIAETEQFLAAALREPHRGPVIPSFPVGHGRISPALAAAFWRRVLYESEAGAGRA